jgi:hypothetical protein
LKIIFNLFSELFKEKEEYRRRVVNTPKYDLVLKLLKNKKTWENFLREVNLSSTSTHKSLVDLANTAEEIIPPKNNVKKQPTRILRHIQSTDDDDDDSIYETDDEEEDDNYRFDTLVGQTRAATAPVDTTTQRLVKLIWTNMNESLVTLLDLSRLAQNEFNKVLVTQVDREKFQSSSPTLQVVLAGLYDMNSRLNEVTSLFRERKIASGKEEELSEEEEEEEEEELITVSVKPHPLYDDRVEIDIRAAEHVKEKVNVTLDTESYDTRLTDLKNEIFALKSDRKHNQQMLEAREHDLMEKDSVLFLKQNAYNEEKAEWDRQTKVFQDEITILKERIQQLEREKQQPIQLVINIKEMVNRVVDNRFNDHEHNSKVAEEETNISSNRSTKNTGKRTNAQSRRNSVSHTNSHNHNNAHDTNNIGLAIKESFRESFNASFKTMEPVNEKPQKKTPKVKSDRSKVPPEPLDKKNESDTAATTKISVERPTEDANIPAKKATNKVKVEELSSDDDKPHKESRNKKKVLLDKAVQAGSGLIDVVEGKPPSRGSRRSQRNIRSAPNDSLSLEVDVIDTLSRKSEFSSRRPTARKLKNERLQQIIQRIKMKAVDIKPKSLLWILRLIRYVLIVF